jgi:FAD/FMN-containing dehydrogenase
MGGQTIAARGVVLDMAFLNAVSYNPATRAVTCGPGATWADLLRHLNRHGRSPRTMQVVVLSVSVW